MCFFVLVKHKVRAKVDRANRLDYHDDDFALLSPTSNRRARRPFGSNFLFDEFKAPGPTSFSAVSTKQVCSLLSSFFIFVILFFFTFLTTFPTLELTCSYLPTRTSSFRWKLSCSTLSVTTIQDLFQSYGLESFKSGSHCLYDIPKTVCKQIPTQVTTRSVLPMPHGNEFKLIISRRHSGTTDIAAIVLFRLSFV